MGTRRWSRATGCGEVLLSVASKVRGGVSYISPSTTRRLFLGFFPPVSSLSLFAVSPSTALSSELMLLVRCCVSCVCLCVCVSVSGVPSLFSTDKTTTPLLLTTKYRGRNDCQI